MIHLSVSIIEPQVANSEYCPNNTHASLARITPPEFDQNAINVLGIIHPGIFLCSSIDLHSIVSTGCEAQLSRRLNLPDPLTPAHRDLFRIFLVLIAAKEKSKKRRKGLRSFFPGGQFITIRSSACVLPLHEYVELMNLW